MEFLGLIITGIIVGTLYGLIAMGFSVIYKSSGIFNMAQGEFVLLAAFILWSALTWLHLPVVAAIFFTMVVMSILGIILEILAIMPLIV